MKWAIHMPKDRDIGKKQNTTKDNQDTNRQ
jgi:hypothetical protein